jgi:beta-glucosidase
MNNRKLFFYVAICTILLVALSCSPKPVEEKLANTVIEESDLVQTINGFSFRDLNKDGKLEVYEDRRQPLENRVKNLLGQMTLEEKAGMMFYSMVQVNSDGTIEEKPGGGFFAALSPIGVKEIDQHHLTHFNVSTSPKPDTLAIWYNRMQQYAEKTRLGIPLTIASDPRNQGQGGFYSVSAKTFSMWPSPLGLAAIGDEKLMEQFADISRQEYMAVGIRQALHPQVDLATEPRWPRISGSFSEDAELSARMTKAYIKGYQGKELGSYSVACMAKHFPGGGPQKDGLDPHFKFQKGQVYPGGNFGYHLIPFEAAFAANTAAVMPYYGVPMGQKDVEEVGFSYNKAIITNLLREKYHYNGVVCTDWGLVSDTQLGSFNFAARAWGVENLNTEERVEKLLDAGVDQLGGETISDVIVRLVKEGKVSETRIDTSVSRLLKLKFELGLFDNPFVDASKAVEIVGNPEFIKAAGDAQRRSFTLLKNENKILPLTPNKLKVYIKNINPEVAAKYCIVVDNPKRADFAIVRLQTPSYSIPEINGNLIAQLFHWGDLDFKGETLDEMRKLMKTVPTVVDIYLDRPAVIPEISKNAKALIANYGASDAALLDVLFGKYKPEGHLPFELPSSMEAVRDQKEDLPYDSNNPLYPFGYGLKYE